ncbi:hypothetical protein ACFTXK_14470 [Streptomyces sp. NPDC056956]|uniref:hypothetical protein n=1 Tax=Streptomyces sp. NPDC056956 TaxID=3345980 RepID=UPI003644516C
MAMGGPVVEVAPCLGVVVGERVLIRWRAGPDGEGEVGAGLLPLLVEGVQAVERVAQGAELPGPAGLDRTGGQWGELFFCGGEELPCGGVDGLECFGGLAVALALSEAVGVFVERPAVEVGVLFGVVVPVGQDAGALA